MAVIGQDNNFSNVSWHSDDGDAAGSASTEVPEPDSGNERQQGEVEAQLERLDPGLGGEILECTVSEPHKENDGTKDAYVSYLVSTNVS